MTDTSTDTKPKSSTELPMDIFDVDEDELVAELSAQNLPQDASKGSPSEPKTPEPEAEEVKPAKAFTLKSEFEPVTKPVIEQIQFTTADALESSIVSSGASNPPGEEDRMVMEQDAIANDVEKTFLEKNLKVIVAGLSLALVGYLMIPSKSPHPVIQGQAQISQAQAQGSPGTTASSNASPTQPNTTNPVDAGSALDIATMGASPDEQARLAAEIDKDLMAIPASDQSCSHPSLTSYDQRQCTRYSKELFFKCTENVGRRWNVGIPGCEQI